MKVGMRGRHELIVDAWKMAAAVENVNTKKLMNNLKIGTDVRKPILIAAHSDVYTVPIWL